MRPTIFKSKITVQNIKDCARNNAIHVEDITAK